MSIETERARVSAVTLGNSVDLISRVVKELAGNDISSSLNDTSLTLEGIRCLVVSRMRINLSKLQPSV